MDLNTATFEEIQSLAGIGHGRAQAIFYGRANLSRPLTLLDLLEMGIPADVVKAFIDDLEIKVIPADSEGKKPLRLVCILLPFSRHRIYSMAT